MKIADRYQLQGFTRELLRCFLFVSVFVVLYALIRLRLKNDHFSCSTIFIFILYSFAEILPYLTAIALMTSHRLMQQKSEIQLLQHYRQSQIKHAFFAWPILLPLSLCCAIYTLQLKPEVKSLLGGELKTLNTQVRQPQKLAGGWLWHNSQLQWIKQNNEKLMVLSAQISKDSSNLLNMEQGQLYVQQSNKTTTLDFSSAQWPLGFREGKTQHNFMELIAAGEWSELLFRCNHPLLIFILAGIIYDGHRRKTLTAIAILCSCILLYLTLYFIFRGKTWEGRSCFMSLIPSLGCFWPCFLFRHAKQT